MGRRVVPDPAVTAQRFDPGKKPGFVFAVSKDHGAAHSARHLGGPHAHRRPKLGRAVRVANEQDQDRTTVRPCPGKSHGSLQFRLARKLVAWPSNRAAGLLGPNLRFRYETAQEDRNCVRIATAFHDGLDGRFDLPATGTSASPRWDRPPVRVSGRWTGAVRLRS